jgi:MaoC like domain
MSKVFDSEAQVQFARLSGDWNPLHVDPIAARRTQFGRPLVHGVHLLLWALEQGLDATDRASLARISCSFSGHVGVDEAVMCERLPSANGEQHIRITSRSGDCLTVKVALAGARRDLEIDDRDPQREPAKPHPLEQMAHLRGEMSLGVSRDGLSRLFPRLTRCLPLDQLAFLLATTRVVGMECPGLDSIYSDLTAEMGEPGDGPARRVEWSVREFDARFNRVEIEAVAPGARATLGAFVRPQSRAQPSTVDVRRYVASDAFGGARAVVIGGSRGLGELCVKILAAGGADVRFSYLRGADDAAKVERDVRAAGGEATAFAYDVLSPPEDLAARLGAGWLPTHFYYFPTPPIVGNKKFSPQIFRELCGYYVEGFHALWRLARASYRQPLVFFYPSSVYVEEINAGFGEYSAAKAAGETLCRFIEATDRKAKVCVARLPKLPTDQTLAVFGEELQSDSAEILVRFLQETSARS